MMRTTDTQAGTPSSRFRTTLTGGRLGPLRMMERATGPIHDGSSEESGFERGTLQLRGQNLITRPPRPRNISRENDLSPNKSTSRFGRTFTYFIP
ncbi:hypothetical protein AVEN_263238-1 [Araneus ventricosus]|uniref:Uncharacterized protein n=1 Tax=Araneus ventricosus TaxID=182803 RepID=A0A4Y2R4N1_ARAVE|nr:hypothetical protein AVEN_263238-1 [Araneus ventricosus]